MTKMMQPPYMQNKLVDFMSKNDATTIYAEQVGRFYVVECSRVDHQRSDTMYSRTPFPGIRTNVVRLLHAENVALLVVRLYTKSEELARLYHWFMPSKRSLSDVT